MIGVTPRCNWLMGMDESVDIARRHTFLLEKHRKRFLGGAAMVNQDRVMIDRPKENLVRWPRVCLVMEVIKPLRPGPTGLHVYQLANRFASLGMDFTFITRQTEPALPRRECHGKLVLRRIRPAGLLKGKGWKALGPMAFFLVRVFQLLVTHASQYDIIVACSSRVLPLPAMLAAKVCRKKWIVRLDVFTELSEEITPESLAKMGVASTLISKIIRSIRLPFVKVADSFVAVSSDIRQQLIEIGVSPEKIRVIPNCVDTDTFCPVDPSLKRQLRQKLSLPKEKMIFTFTGRLAAQKGLLYLMDVWNELVCRYEGIQLILVGSGKGSHDNQEDEIKHYVRANDLASSVILTGEVSNVHEYLQASDAYVLPSEYEGFALSLVEAMACGLPALTTSVSGSNELIRDRENGILVRPRDRQELLEGMEWLLEDRDRSAALGSRGRDTILERYSIKAEVEEYLNVFKQILQDGRQQP